ncbi:hypothetical protein [Vibrio phage vB_VmeM-Yong XC32]|nr:hypothetical protein [Vibrio phage vB_VmeM-Yong XC31]QAX96386.1 hypothetical protein [Vibrio phage vB_VmeM-Yong XC32]QAX96704.1 hypothetical protein [Vibrio phage vB_VmeM-Yong MS31]QAX97022.1 hypothetical protein [Vibrio phage vB_VmeM-Yong MS32]
MSDYNILIRHRLAGTILPEATHEARHAFGLWVRHRIMGMDPDDAFDDVLKAFHGTDDEYEKFSEDITYLMSELDERHLAELKAKLTEVENKLCLMTGIFYFATSLDDHTLLITVSGID